jgi:beta-N-acetylhexosaminidase
MLPAMFMRRFLPLSLLAVLMITPMVSAKDKNEKFLSPGPIRVDKDGEKWAEKTLKKMSVEEKVGQMFMIWARVTFINFDSPQYKDLRDTMRKYHVGGFGVTVPVESGILIRNQPYEAAMLLNQLQRDAEVPVLMAADFERGLSMRLYGATVFPHAMAFGATGKAEYAEAFGRITAEEARAIGIHWNWFPDADVNSNPLNPIINTRAFGANAQQVGDMVAAYIKGAHEAGMLTTAKHFPGHGDTATDSHLGMASVAGDAARLNSVELPPFEKAIQAGVDSVMIAHVTVPALEPDSNVVASTSKKITTDLLKDKMGFKGLVVTDALDMNGLMRIYADTPNPSASAAVAAVKAGNDMILIPQDLDGAYNGIVSAVKKGEISEAQLNASVLKILKMKASLGLNKARLVDPQQVGLVVGKPANVQVGQQVADAAVTLVRDNGQALPLKLGVRGTNPTANAYTQVQGTTNRVVSVIFTEDVRSEMGRTFDRAFRARMPDARVMMVDANIAAGMTDQVMAAVQQAERVVVPVYAVPTAGKVTKNAAGQIVNTFALEENLANLLHHILQVAGPKAVVIAMGNPYLASDFPEVQNYLCTFSNATVSEVSAVKAVFGEIPIQGRLPVNIPGIAEQGAGISKPQVLKGGQVSDEIDE